MKLRAADLFCGAGGAAMGIYRAGFEVEGWDIKPQPRYPFKFHQGDALEADLSGFDFVWASPPCQKHTRMSKGLLQSQGRAKNHECFIDRTRVKLSAWSRECQKPWIIENVIGSPLVAPLMLCGSSFGLKVQRHRLFESNIFLLSAACAHGQWNKDKPALHQLQGKSRVVGCYGNGRGKGDTVSAWRNAMEIDWMTRAELSQAIPPVYSEFLCRQISLQLQNKNKPTQ